MTYIMMSDAVKKLLGKVCYEIFWESSTLLCIYSKVDKRIIQTNESVNIRLGGVKLEPLDIFVDAENEIYMTIQGVPCKLTTLSQINEDMCVVEMVPAHTRKWIQTSDLVYLTDKTSDGVWEWYPEMNFEYMSERFWNVLGYDQKDMEENPQVWMDVVHPDDVKGVQHMRDQHIASKGEIPCISKARYYRSDGAELILLCRAYIIDWLPDGRPWRVLGTYTDITDIVKKDALEAKSVFISRMSHEIRSPLCTILNECEMLGTKINTKIITDTCKHLVSITNDILHLGKLSHSPMKLCTEKRDMMEIISTCVRRHRSEAKKNGVKIQALMGDLPDIVEVDPGKFNQVMDNLVTNAIKYSNEGSLITITPEYDFKTSICSVWVKDTGIGMSTELRKKAFEEFVQGDDTMQGAGIGLSLARRIAKFMGGNVVIEKSELGVGTTMLFTTILVGDLANSEKNKSMTVLVVDDMTTNRVILKRRLQCLKDMGLVFTDVLEASNGKEAVEKFKEYNGKVNIVLMDCHMPILDGFESTLQIHNLCGEIGMKNVPIIAVTASVSAELHDKCLSHGMMGVVTKPYSENDLLFAIVSCIGPR